MTYRYYGTRVYLSATGTSDSRTSHRSHGLALCIELAAATVALMEESQNIANKTPLEAPAEDWEEAPIPELRALSIKTEAPTLAQHPDSSINGHDVDDL